MPIACELDQVARRPAKNASIVSILGRRLSGHIMALARHQNSIVGIRVCVGGVKLACKTDLGKEISFVGSWITEADTT